MQLKARVIVLTIDYKVKARRKLHPSMIKGGGGGGGGGRGHHTHDDCTIKPTRNPPDMYKTYEMDPKCRIAPCYLTTISNGRLFGGTPIFHFKKSGLHGPDKWYQCLW